MFTNSGTRAKRRSALLRDLDLLGQHHRQLIVRHRNQPIALAVDHGNRRAPIALAAHAPILQAIRDRRFAKAAADGDVLESSLRFCAAQPSNSPELTSTPSSVVNGSSGSSASGSAGAMTRRIGNRILLRELEVALVMPWHAHDGARAVVHQDIIRNPDRHPLAVVRIDGEMPGRHAVLLDRADVAGFRAFFCSSISSSTCAFSSASPAASCVTSGCSGASCTLVAPKIVSTRVVKTRIRCSLDPVP